MSSLSGHIHRFSDFTIDIEQKVLLRGGKAMPMAPKVFETLLALVENHGRIVLKEELMKRLWPDTFVEESNLTFNIQQLRKSLGDNAREPLYIETIPRRGYRFIAEVKPLAIPVAPAQINTRDEPVTRAPVLSKARVITVLAVVGVAIAGLVYWSFARSGSKSSREINAKDAPGGRLKLVELTATGTLLTRAARKTQLRFGCDNSHRIRTSSFLRQTGLRDWHSIRVERVFCSSGAIPVPCIGCR
jgi:DNA-binding winged helix-turn-helix (wHTH) protein